MKDDGGFVLAEVTPNSPAAKAGLKTGDTLLNVGTNAIHDNDDLALALLDFKPGDEVELTVKRGAGNLTLRATMGKHGRNKAE